MKAVVRTLPVVLVALLSCGAAASAEEFHLADGTKVKGKIVGYERDTFKVETATGIVEIYRQQLRRIVFYPPSGPQTLEPGTTRVRATGTVQRPAPPAKPPEVAGDLRLRATAAPLAGDLPRPVAPPKPDRMVESIGATSYRNDSFGFQLYKPPSWRSYPGLVKPDNPLLAALGTPDESTLLLVGQEIFQGDLVTYSQLAEESLRDLYPDYRKLEERFTQFAGFAAIEREFTGTAAGRFWTGLAIYFAHGESYYTFLGVSSENETLSFQQSLLRKIVNTVQFGRGH